MNVYVSMEQIYSEGIKNGEKRGEKRGELKKAIAVSKRKKQNG